VTVRMAQAMRDLARNTDVVNALNFHLENVSIDIKSDFQESKEGKK
jgi:hypothetical protein